jgi:fimbrial chaperone protein
MCARPLAAFATALFMSAPTLLQAASLQVSPVGVEVQAPGAAATITLRNEGATALNAQIRVFRWVQLAGEEKLEPTDDVVASPPITTLAPSADYTVRIVRVTKEPLSAAEGYRLLVDELPDSAARRNRVVTLVLRYSIPVFFYPRDAAEAKLAWSVEQRSGRVYVSATNDGDRHVRISALKLRDDGGTVASFGSGLIGYVLGRSTMRWTAAASTNQSRIGRSIVISAQGDFGPINASPSEQPIR